MKPLKLIRYALAGWLPGGRRRCVLCGHYVWRFMPYLLGSAGSPELMNVLDTIGSNADQFECPRCGSHDRERHLLMYMEKTGLFESLVGKTILHFAPEKRLSLRLMANRPVQYVRCDLYPNAPEILRVDMLNMQFENDSFDLLIANHVLEHVDDDLMALREILRVLKPGGHAILQTPYSSKLHNTWEDSGINDDASRLQAYGQSDHVRLFGRDIFTRFESVGLVSRVRHHRELLSHVDTTETGVNVAEPFFLFQKP